MSMIKAVDIHRDARLVVGAVPESKSDARGSRRWVPSRLARFLLDYDALAYRLAAEAALHSGQRVLHLGCGSGELLLTLAGMYPEVILHGLESAQNDLKEACRRANAIRCRIEFRRGLVLAPPYPPSSFHHVVFTPMLRGISVEEKVRAWVVSCRLLKPGGVLHTIDWGQPRNAAARWRSALAQWICGLSAACCWTGDESPAAMTALAGFASVETAHEESSSVGTLAVYRAQRHSRSGF
jgi:ubiquinone/menaquinone biosynthesis C-methylase UbiE